MGDEALLLAGRFCGKRTRYARRKTEGVRSMVDPGAMFVASSEAERSFPAATAAERLATSGHLRPRESA